ncbi:MAG TPA: RtcB family protein, partial [Roseiflexaceae bacterium]|nr:RtcB family protein [Roseiflexaceae bacterium]
MKQIDNIPIWGEHDDATVAQIQRCAADEHAAAAALMADGHKGYAMPIGGVIGYRNAVSPNGVGFDIACLAAGTPVTSQDGYWLPIEQVCTDAPITCWDGERVRSVQPNLGMVARGTKPTLVITLRNGRVIQATSDHHILTREGWKEAGALTKTDQVACQPFIGMPYEAPNGKIDLAIENEQLQAKLAAKGLFPLFVNDSRFPALVRLLAYISGDGHLSKDGKQISIYTTNEIDAAAMTADFERLGYSANTHRRQRKEHYRAEILIRVNSRALHALFASLGSPVGRKCWLKQPMPWLFALPGWVRAQFLSAFCSAEMMTPRLQATYIPNLQLKQAGENTHAIDFIANLLRSLGFAASVAQSGPTRGARRDYVLQLLGGEAEQIRFIEEIGFCYAYEKRVAAARVSSMFWERMATVQMRCEARSEARRLKQSGMHWKTVIDTVTQQFAVADGFVRHAMYSERGLPRYRASADREPMVCGEMCWEPVIELIDGETLPVFDIVTDDPAHAFFASGIVVHNCGNKAVLTNLRADDIRADVGRIVDEIAANVVFGVGQTSGLARDHVLFDDPAWRDLKDVGKLRTLAREQLGTVGSGNHYVDLFADEQGRVWVGVHFGSRGLGHKICTGFMNLSLGRAFDDRAPGESMDQPATVFTLDSALGQEYWQAMELAGRYAYAGRDTVVQQVLDILGAQALEAVHN